MPISLSGSLNLSGSLTTTGTITATTLVVQTITSSISSITGSTNFGSLADNTHTFTGSLNVTGALYVPTGSVGIGNINPSYSLDVSGTIRGTTSAYFATTGGSVGIGSTTIYNGGGFGRVLSIYETSTVALSLVTSAKQFQVGISGTDNDYRIYDFTNTTYRFVINGSTGNVGIGTSSPNSTLQVLKSGATFQVTDTGKTANNTFSVYGLTQTSWAIATGNSGSFSGGEKIVLLDNGNVGIGTTSPASQATGTTTGILDVSAAAGGNLVLHRNGSGDTALFSILKASNGTYIDSTGAATAANNAIYFRTNNINADQTSLTTALTIASTGAATFSSTITAGVITGDSLSTGVASIIAKVGGGGNNGTYGFGNNTDYLIKGGSDFGNMQFVAGGSGNTRITIQGSTGDVYIGTTT